MAKITNLAPAGPLTGDEHVPLVQNGVTRRVFIGSHILSLAMPYVAQAAEARDITIASAAIFYPTKELGEAGSANGEIFAVAPGDGTATYWKKGVPSQQLFQMATKALVDNLNPYNNLSTFKAQDTLNKRSTLIRGADTGEFVWIMGDHSAEVAVDTVGAIYIASDVDPTGTLGVWKRVYSLFDASFFGIASDGVTDDSAKWQAAINVAEVIGGTTIYFSGKSLIGGLIVTNQRINISGYSKNDELIVKSGTLGIWYKEGWLSLSSFTMRSQGNKGDGLNTSGILLQKARGSTGHVFAADVEFHGFSGFGLQAVNTLNFVMTSTLFKDSKIGLDFTRGGSGGKDFSTTIFLRAVYVIGCDTGIKGRHVYRSEFNVIGEYCGIAIEVEVGDLTLRRCYFENNSILGAKLDAVGGSDVEIYKNNAVTDQVARTRGVIGNTAWYTNGQYKGDFWTKRVGLQSAWGRDIKWLTGIGTVANIGLKYDEAIVPRIYGEDLLVPTAWTSETTTEFGGWSVSNSGYSIVTELTGVRGIRQVVPLDSTKTYVMDFASTNISGNPISTVQVDGVAVVPGNHFEVGSTGNKVIRCFAGQTGPSENYVNAFRLYEVMEDQSFIAKTSDRLSRAPTQRADIYAPSPPTTGFWALGEKVYNDLSVTQDYEKWICTEAGSPGTWKGCGTIEG